MHKHAVAAALALVALATPAAAVNKCSMGGRVVYQDAPCPSGSAAEPVDTSGAGRADLNSSGARQARRDAREAEIGYLVTMRRVAIGMSSAHVREAWGEPNVINRSVGNYGTHDQWVYRRAGLRDQYVYLENGIVTAIQGPGD